jgi:hypothetical protein
MNLFVLVGVGFEAQDFLGKVRRKVERPLCAYQLPAAATKVDVFVPESSSFRLKLTFLYQNPQLSPTEMPHTRRLGELCQNVERPLCSH